MLLRINVINSFGFISDLTNLFSKKFDLKKLCENTSPINGLLQEIKATVDLCKQALGLSIYLTLGLLVKVYGNLKLKHINFFSLIKQNKRKFKSLSANLHT